MIIYVYTTHPDPSPDLCEELSSLAGQENWFYTTRPIRPDVVHELTFTFPDTIDYFDVVDLIDGWHGNNDLIVQQP